MAESVSNIKTHSCPSCGGQLRVNLNRQMYECPFCGATYDYEYFREDDVLSRASQFLRNGEWVAATDAYDFLLTKEPHNYDALLGKILAAAHMKRQEDMAKIEFFRSMDYVKVKDCTSQALRDTDSTHKEYFEKVQELFACGEEYATRKDNIEKSKQRCRLENNKLEAKKDERSMPIALMMLVVIPLGAFALYFLLRYFVDKSNAEIFNTDMYRSIYLQSQEKDDFALILAFVALALMIIPVIYCLIKYFRAKRSINKDLESINENLVTLKESLKSDIDEADAMQKRIRSLYYEIRKLVGRC